MDDYRLDYEQWIESYRPAESQRCQVVCERPEIVRIIEETVERDGQYRTLKGDDRRVARKYYKAMQCQCVCYMNPALHAPGKCIHVKACDGSLIATRYERVTVSDHGAYVEIEPSCLSEQIVQAMRGIRGMALRGAKSTVFRIEQPKLDLHRQDERVQFGDFEPGMYYVKPTQVLFETVEAPQVKTAAKRTTIPPKGGGVAKTNYVKPLGKCKRGQTSLDKFLIAGKANCAK